MRDPDVIRGVAAAGPTLSWANKKGTAVANVTGTSTVGEGSWQLQLQKDFQSNGKLAITIEHLHGGYKSVRPVLASGVYTDIIPGLTITFAAVINFEDITNISYTSMYIVNT